MENRKTPCLPSVLYDIRYIKSFTFYGMLTFIRL